MHKLLIAILFVFCGCQSEYNILMSDRIGTILKPRGYTSPAYYPARVAWDNSVPRKDVVLAIEWWDAQLEDYFGEDRPLKIEMSIIDPTIEITYAPIEDENVLGRAELKIRGVPPTLQKSKIVVDPEKPNMASHLVLIHELGHAVYALDDDHELLNYYSIMAAGFCEKTRLSSFDASVIYEQWKEYQNND